jgi:putative tricarboxylic transport membrane protein
MKKWNAGVWAGIVVLAFSLFIFSQSHRYPYSGSLGLGPGYFPVWISGAMILLSILYIYESARGANASGESMPERAGLIKIVFILLCLIGFVVLLPYLGFIVTGSLFLYVFLLREYRWYQKLVYSVGISMFLFWLFGSILHVALPVNALGW